MPRLGDPAPGFIVGRVWDGAGWPVAPDRQSRWGPISDDAGAATIDATYFLTVF